MKVLVVGSGGREHALVWKIAQSPEVDQVIAAPGSEAMRQLAECHPDVSVGDLNGIVELARAESIDLVVVGPEDPLAAGLSDRLREEGVSVFGPSAAAAQLEGSKAFAKAFMVRHGIPTAGYRAFSDLDEALAYVEERGGRSVIKADGLAAGKGVAMCETPRDAERALREMMAEKRFGDAGNSVVIEDWLVGEEASYYAVSDGEHFVTLAAAQDHKRALDGDRGENTGGMGAYSPAPVVDEAVEERVLDRIVRPAIAGNGRGRASLCRGFVCWLDDRFRGRPLCGRIQCAVWRPRDAALDGPHEWRSGPFAQGGRRRLPGSRDENGLGGGGGSVS